VLRIGANACDDDQIVAGNLLQNIADERQLRFADSAAVAAP